MHILSFASILLFCIEVHKLQLINNYFKMHKNSYNPKVLNGNWCEERFTDAFDRKHDNSSNTFLSNPSYSKYVPTSKAIGN